MQIHYLTAFIGLATAGLSELQPSSGFRSDYGVQGGRQEVQVTTPISSSTNSLQIRPQGKLLRRQIKPKSNQASTNRMDMKPHPIGPPLPASVSKSLPLTQENAQSESRGLKTGKTGSSTQEDTQSKDRGFKKGKTSSLTREDTQTRNHSLKNGKIGSTPVSTPDSAAKFAKGQKQSRKANTGPNTTHSTPGEPKNHNLATAKGNIANKKAGVGAANGKGKKLCRRSGPAHTCDRSEPRPSTSSYQAPDQQAMEDIQGQLASQLSLEKKKAKNLSTSNKLTTGILGTGLASTLTGTSATFAGVCCHGMACGSATITCAAVGTAALGATGICFGCAAAGLTVAKAVIDHKNGKAMEKRLDERIDGLSNEQHTQSQKLSQVGKTADDSINKANSLGHQVVDAQKTAATAGKEAQDAKTTATEAKKEAEALRTHVGTVEQKVDNRAKSFKKTASELNLAAEQNKGQLKELGSKVDTALSRADSVGKGIVDAKSEAYQAKLQAATNAKTAAEAKEEALRRKKSTEDLRKELDDAKRSHENLRKGLDEAKTDNGLLKLGYGQHSKSLDDMRSSTEKLRTSNSDRLARHSGRLKTMEERLDTYQQHMFAHENLSPMG